MLKAFSDMFPYSKIFACDVDDYNRTKFEQIPNFSGMWKDVSEIDEKFDCITTIHCLEHIINLDIFLTHIWRLLEDDGILIIQVPNVLQAILDVFIYDHCHHFAPITLAFLLKRYNFEVYYPSEQIDRQITIIAKKQKSEAVNLKPIQMSTLIDEKIKKLDSFLRECSKQRDKKKPSWVFGSSPLSHFIGHFLGESCQAFLDENQNRIGKLLMSKNIEDFNMSKGETLVIPFEGLLGDRIVIEYVANNFIMVK